MFSATLPAHVEALARKAAADTRVQIELGRLSVNVLTIEVLKKPLEISVAAQAVAKIKKGLG